MADDEIDEWSDFDMKKAVAHEIGAGNGLNNTILGRLVLATLVFLLPLLILRCLVVLQLIV